MSESLPVRMIVMRINTEEIVSISTFIYYYTCFLAIEVTFVLSFAVYQFNSKNEKRKEEEQLNKEIEKENKEREFNEKLKAHLNSYIEYSIMTLISFIPDSHDGKLPFKDELFENQTYFRIALKEIENLQLGSIPTNYVKAISDLKLLYQIIDAELERILKADDNPEKLIYELNAMNITGRTLIAIRHYSQVTNDKDMWANIIQELEQVTQRKR